jgi:low temperature requirement protein LtrA
MHAPDDNTTPSGSALLRRLIRPWEYRHARAVGSVRFVAGGFQLGVGLVLLSLGRQAQTEQERRKCFRWSAWFLVMAALQLVGGCLDMAADRSAPPRT